MTSRPLHSSYLVFWSSSQFWMSDDFLQDGKKWNKGRKWIKTEKDVRNPLEPTCEGKRAGGTLTPGEAWNFVGTQFPSFAPRYFPFGERGEKSERALGQKIGISLNRIVEWQGVRTKFLWRSRELSTLLDLGPLKGQQERSKCETDRQKVGGIFVRF